MVPPSASTRSGLQVREPGNLYVFGRTCFAQEISKRRRLVPDIDVATKIDGIPESARLRPYGQGAKFLREGFAVVVGHDLQAIVRHVGVRTH